jgi:phospholipid/cholesterol/gamma-HCH transport system substrate-binding protein
MATDRSTPRAEIEEEEEGSRARRVLALAALLAAAALVFYLLFWGEEYTVTAEFQNAAQLVEGNQVVVGGVPAGSVEDIALGPNGEALVTFTVSDQYAPLEEGTVATIRSPSLSQIAGRQVQLTLPPEGREGEPIPDEGLIPQSQTVSAVDLDQIFNTLNDRTVRNLKKVIRGFEVSYDGVGAQANRGFKYLNPFLYTSRRLFSELTYDERTFERLIVDTSRLSGALAQRSPDISQLVHNLNLMMGAIGRQKEALAEAVAGLPDFMRNFNTTAVNLRATLDDLDPLVAASKPAALKLQEFLPELRGTARDLVPTVRDLDRIVKHRGKDNDLVDLTRLQVPLAEIAVGPVNRNGAQRKGAFPESVQALEDSLTNLEFFRAYTPELVGWFNDFGTSGIQDANGGIGRIGTTLNTFTFSTPPGTETLPPNLAPFSLLPPTPQTPLEQFFSDAGFSLDNLKRCPGANERNPGDNSTPFTAGGTLDCDPSQVPVGP